MIKLYSNYKDSIFIYKEYVENYISLYIKDLLSSKSTFSVEVSDSGLEDKNNIIVTIKLSKKNNYTYDKLEHLYFEIKYLLKSIFSIEQSKINIIIG